MGTGAACGGRRKAGWGGGLGFRGGLEYLEDLPGMEGGEGEEGVPRDLEGGGAVEEVKEDGLAI